MHNVVITYEVLALNQMELIMLRMSKCCFYACMISNELKYDKIITCLMQNNISNDKVNNNNCNSY